MKLIGLSALNEAKIPKMVCGHFSFPTVQKKNLPDRDVGIRTFKFGM